MKTMIVLPAAGEFLLNGTCRARSSGSIFQSKNEPEITRRDSVVCL